MARSDAAGGPAHEGGDLRVRILSASVTLIEEQGLSALSMREVARRAGVSHQAPYHHFADREAIMGAIAEEGFRLLSERLEQALRSDPEQLPPVRDRIVTAGRVYVEFACEHPAHFRVMFRPELVNLEKCPGALSEGDRAFSFLTEVVHDAVKRGLKPDPSEQALVVLAWSVAHGLACLILDGPLAHKLPAAERSTHIYGVTNALGALIDRALAGGDSAKVT
jgi:AcrR family transcriptional regulator